MSEATVTITPMENGPNLVQGAIQITVLGADGKPVDHPATVALCRCGQSSNKPFCDGTHRKVGFQAAGVRMAPKSS